MPVRLWQFIGLAVFLAVLAPGAACGADVASPRASAAPPAAFTLLDGDRVVLLGSTFIERDQSHGYLEAALTSRFHSQKLQFRNLGWSGDTVFGEARAGFGTVADGFENLKRHVLALEPTVILLSYGANESFAGQAELDSFTRGLDVLLATLDETKARIVFIVPPPQEKLSPPLPDPTEHNRDLKRYCKAIAAAAAKRQAPFVDLFALLGPKLEPPAGVPLTDNGLHLTDYGYWRAAPVIEQALSLPPRRWKIEIDVKRQNVFSNGTKLSDVKVAPTAVSFQALDEQLPLAAPPPGSPPGSLVVTGPRVVRLAGLSGGKYVMYIAGHKVGVATAEQWAGGVALGTGPDFAQVEMLRRAIVAKNRLYFYRWRPQNETYLFGFRKHEQGNNAVEIPQFDPLVAEQEAAIRTLSAPVPRDYQIIRLDAK